MYMGVWQPRLFSHIFIQTNNFGDTDFLKCNFQFKFFFLICTKLKPYYNENAVTE